MGKTKVLTSQRDMHASFKKHSSFLKESKGIEPPISHYLLKFYTVECGLKTLHLINNKAPRKRPTRGTDPELFNHKLGDLIKKLRISASEITAIPRFHLKKDKHDPSISYAIEEVHIAWRYGAILTSQDEQDLNLWLDKVRELIEQRLNGG